MSLTTNRNAAFALGAGISALLFASLASCAASNADDKNADDAGTTVIVSPTDSGLESSAQGDADAAEAETSLPPCGVGNLCNVPIPISIGYVVALAGRSKSDVWASASRGELLHWDGQAWAHEDSGGLDTFSNLFLTPDELWGVSGNLVMRRGLDASTIRSFRLTQRYIGMTGVVVLPSGEPYVSFGTTWNATETPAYLARVKDFDAKVLEFFIGPIDPSTLAPVSMAARALWLAPDETLWVVGDRGIVVRFPTSPVAGGTLIPLDSQADLFAAWGGHDDLWVGGSGGTIARFDGTVWHEETTGTSATIRAMFGFSSTDVWAAGDEGTVLHFDGATWSKVSTFGYTGPLMTIWGSGPDDVWIGGEYAMFHWGALP
ncbi:hypothetical protein AKJ09_10605 [Labilithrix luteola]|uniref:Type IV fimbrial biogenesis protein PilY1 n=1 Tax=Labilithrix luteola TaxID=1391654 RepID=A0A0K1QE52_9BACT|nr:hypothetical protein [Labilithrix luteola]AKV03942.1 hypothetical protein AKJ09_10605 [Labilithrix luteola]